MLVASLLLLQQLISFINCIRIPNVEHKELTNCISKIILTCFERGSTVTIVNRYYDGDEIIKTVNSINFVTINSRTNAPAVHTTNDAYIITINNTHDIFYILKALKHDFGWKPNAKFVILTKFTDAGTTAQIFKHLLNYRVDNVVIVSGSRSRHLYTYNPYEYNGCGKTFKRIIPHGRCATANLTNLYPKLPDKIFKNCSLKAFISNSPPFTSNEEPNIRRLNNLGVEQYIMEILAELEQFKIVYTFYGSEEFSLITNNMSVEGPLRLVHENKVDMIFGAMMLLDKRAKVFSYLWSHVTFVDELKIIVKKAGVEPIWKNVYSEFHYSVWILLLVTFLIIFTIINIKLRPKDKSNVMLMMLEHLLQHGSKLGNAVCIRWITIHWIVFAYLISSYYQPYLTGLMTHPNPACQLSNEKDLKGFKVKPYLSTFLKRFIVSLTETQIEETEQTCDLQLECLRKVSESYHAYTVALYSLYQQSKWKFCDTEGNHLLYPFERPYSKIIYAIYFDKGFPLTDKLHLHTLRIKESGIGNKYLNDFYCEQNRKFYSSTQQSKHNFVIPWHILVCGSCLSTVSFILEIIIRNY